MLRWILMLAIMFTGTAALAGEFNQKLNIGDAAPAFSGIEAVEDLRADLERAFAAIGA